MLGPSDMKGRVALITGAATGLGRATALSLARAGANVCLVDINASDLESTANDARGFDVRALVHVADISMQGACREAVAAALTTFGRLDALCNVAGVFLPNHAHEMPQADFARTLAVNLAGPFYLIQAAIPHLLETRGAVVNVTSCAAHKAQAYSAAYCATKAGLSHMTKALAIEYSKQSIRFNAVAPGGMMTALAQNVRNIRDPDVDLMKRISPVRGMVEIDEVAAMVAFLASDAAHGYHGACINVDNGITAD